MTLIEHSHFIQLLSKRDLQLRIRNSFLGALWLIIQPLLLLVMYSFVFGGIFKSRWSDSNDVHFIFIFYSGYLVYNFIADTVIRSTPSMVHNSNFIKKAVFPVEVLPWSIMVSNMFNFMINVALVVALFLFTYGHIPLTVLFLPVLLMPLILFVMGVSLLAASINVYIRDLENFMNLLFVFLLFGTPIFYSLEIVPAQYVMPLKLNPLYFFVESMRAILCFGKLPGLFTFAWVTAFYGVFYWMSLLVFRKLRKGFGDLL